MKDPENPLNALSALDWIAVLGVCAGALFCFLFPFVIAPQFAKMFKDFGGELPDITQLGLTIWFPLMLGLNPASIVFHALSGKHTLFKRRMLIVAAFVMALAAIGVLLFAMYAPIFAIAGNIK